MDLFDLRKFNYAQEMQLGENQFVCECASVRGRDFTLCQAACYEYGKEKS